jgi:hypothetical protein
LCACSHPGHGFSSACAVVFFVVFNFDITIHTSMELLFCIQIMYIIHENIYNKMYCWEILSEKQLALSFLEYITHTHKFWVHSCLTRKFTKGEFIVLWSTKQIMKRLYWNIKQNDFVFYGLWNYKLHCSKMI